MGELTGYAWWAAVRDLGLDDLDLPDRRITIAGHPQRLGELTCQALRAWLSHRRATWPHTPNGPRPDPGEDRPRHRAGQQELYLTWDLQRHRVSIERIRRDGGLHLHAATSSAFVATGSSKL